MDNFASFVTVNKNDISKDLFYKSLTTTRFGKYFNQSRPLDDIVIKNDLILNQTPHIHIYNEIEPSKKQPIDLYNNIDKAFNVVHSIKPKLSQEKIHNALPIIKYLNEDSNVKGAIPQVKAQIFYVAGSIKLGGNLIGVNPLEEAQLFNLQNYIIKGSTNLLYNTKNGILIGSGVADKLSLDVGDRVQISTIDSNACFLFNKTTL